MRSNGIGHQNSSSNLDWNQAKFHLFLAQNMTKLARKWTPHFLTNFNMWKLSQKGQETSQRHMKN